MPPPSTVPDDPFKKPYLPQQRTSEPQQQYIHNGQLLLPSLVALKYASAAVFGVLHELLTSFYIPQLNLHLSIPDIASTHPRLAPLQSRTPLLHQEKPFSKLLQVYHTHLSPR